jgi:hypothetical protein
MFCSSMAVRTSKLFLGIGDAVFLSTLKTTYRISVSIEKQIQQTVESFNRVYLYMNL